MKTLELNQMEKIQGGGRSFLHGMLCGAAVVGFAVFMIGSGGSAGILLGPLLATSTAGAGCLAMIR
jgi:hypothetical protein